MTKSFSKKSRKKVLSSNLANNDTKVPKKYFGNLKRGPIKNTRKVLLIGILIGISIGIFFLLFLIGLVHQFLGFVVYEGVESKIVSPVLGVHSSLEIKTPASFLGKDVNHNKNKRMEFATPEGSVRLYFDLMNYSEFIDHAAKETDSYTNASSLDSSSENSGSASENSGSLTGNVITDSENSSNDSSLGEVSSDNNSQLVPDVSLIKQDIESMSTSSVENISDSAVIPAENFDVNVTSVPSATDKSKNNYKWGYKVQLKDLNFMAKIKITADSNILISDNSSLKIGNNVLSFQDLIDQGYTIRIERPDLSVFSDEEKRHHLKNNSALINPENSSESNLSEINNSSESSPEANNSGSENNSSAGSNSASVESNSSSTSSESSSENNSSSTNTGNLDDSPIFSSEREPQNQNPDTSSNSGSSQQSSQSSDNSGNSGESSSVEDSGSSADSSAPSGITGNIIKGISGLVVAGKEVPDTEYKNSVEVYVAKDFSNNSEGIKVGDIINLDPMFYIESGGSYSYCYQESASTSNQSGTDGSCGQTYTGVYSSGSWSASNCYDGNWSTASAGQNGYTLYINYSKPSNNVSLGTLWYVKDGNGSANLTLSSSCVSQSPLQLKINVSSSCVSGDTKILMADLSEKEIRDIQIGEEVLSYDSLIKKNTISKVTKLFYYPANEAADDYYYLINNKLKITPDHNIYLNGNWTSVEDAKVGDYLTNENGNKEYIKTKEKIIGRIDVYNLEINDTHDYYADDYLVHNAGGLYYYYSCWSGSSWGSYLRKTGQISAGVYEEGIFWNVSSSTPTVSIAYPANGSAYTSVTQLNYTYSGTLSSCWYSNDSGTTNSTPVSVGTNWTGLFVADGTYTWIVYCNDSGGIVYSANTTFTQDVFSPVFSNPWEDSGNLSNSGIGNFNITVDNTNGTVYLNINGSSVLATNLSSNVYNASYNFTTSGTYLYNWTSYGNGTSHILGISSNRNYLVNYVPLLSNCTQLNSANTAYTLTGNITASGTCFNVTASNVTINCKGYSIFGNGSGTGVLSGNTGYGTSGYSFTALNCSITNFTTSVNSSGISGNSGYPPVVGGNGGNINLSNSNLSGNIVSNGGNGGASTNSIAQGAVGGRGGVINLSNSNLSGNIVSNGGNGGNGFSGSHGGNGGNGGNIILASSLFSNLSCYRGTMGSGSGMMATNGNGGNISIASSLVNLTNLVVNASGVANGVLIINYSSGFEDVNTVYSNIRLVIINNFGIINFLNNNVAGGTGLNLSTNLQINNNSVYISPSDTFNQSVNLTLYGIGNRSFSRPIILRNDVISTNTYNFTALTASTVIFNASSVSGGHGNYSIGDEPPAPPVVSIIYPANGTYLNMSISQLNYSATSDFGVDSCWYSNSSGVWNSTPSVYDGTNFTTGIPSNEGTNNWTVYCNNSVGTGSNSVIFNQDTIFPNITINSPANGNTYLDTSQIVNITSSEAGSGTIIPNIDNSLVSWWRMDDLNSTGGIVDYMGINNGTNYSVTQTSSGKFGKAMSFNGINSSVLTNNSILGNRSAPWTISLWLNAPVMTSGEKMLYFNGAAANNYPRNGLCIESTGVGKVRIAVGAYAIWQLVKDSSISLNSSTWYHVVGTYDGSSTTAGMLIYINGKLDSSAIGSGSSGSDAEGYYNTFMGSDNGSTGYFNGSLDDVMFFNRTLSSTEILALYNATAPNYTYNFSTNGNHNVTAYIEDFAGNIGTNSSTFTISSDIDYPQFYNSWSDNASLFGSGTGHFNVSVNNTNGTVYLNINGTSVLATNLSSNVYNASYTFLSGRNYIYNWSAYGNGTNNHFNSSSNTYYLVNSSYPNITINSPANGGSYSDTSETVNISSSEAGSGTIIPNIDNSLVSWWRMDELNSTGDVVDYLGRNNGTNVGAVQNELGKFGQSMSFNGSSYIRTTDSQLPSGSQPWSVGCWFYRNSGSSNAELLIADWGTDGSINERADADIYNNHFGYKGYVGSDEFGTITITKGVWHFGVLAYDGSKFYSWVDGVQDMNGVSDSLNVLKSGVLVIGTPLNNLGSPTYSWNGSLDDVMVFNRTLSSAEVLALYNATAPNYVYNFSTTGSHSITAYAETSSGNVNSSTSTFTISSDTVYPQFSGSLTSFSNGSEYNPGDNYQFNITIANTNGTAKINFNGTNYSLSNVSNSFYWNTSLGAGTYSYYFWAYGNGTGHLFNLSVAQNYTVVKNSSYVLILNPTTPISYGTSTNFNSTKSGCPGSLTCSLNLTDGIFGVGNVSANYSTPGNTNYSGNSTTATVVINPASPSGSLTSSLGWTINESQSVTIGYSESQSGDSDVSYRVYKDGVLKNSGETWNPSLGSYSYILNTTGGANWSSNPSMDTKTLVVNDVTNPLISIVSPSEGFNSSDKNLDINYTASDMHLSSCWYSNDSYSENTSINCSQNITGVTWSEGSHTVTVFANDTSGNVNSSTVSFSVDSIAPALSVVSPEDGTNSTNTQLNVDYTATDSHLANCSWSVNSGINNSINCSQNITGHTWSQGLNSVTVYANDSYGNINSSTVSFFIDSAAPTINVFSPNGNTYLVNTIPANFTVSDSGVGVSSCWWENETGENLSIHVVDGVCQNFTFTQDVGTHYFYLWANDTLGNLAFSNTSYEIRTSGPPIVNLVYPINWLNNGTNVDFNFTAQDANGIGIKNCSLYGNFSGSFAMNQSNTTLVSNPGEINYNFKLNLSDGYYIWDALCFESTGQNSSFALVNKTFAVDTTKPFVGITYPVMNQHYNTSVTQLNYSASDANPSLCWYSNDSGTHNYSVQSFDTNFPNMISKQGSNTWTVYCNDSAGNVNSTSVTFVLDTSYPQFSNYQDNKHTLTNYGTGLFNVTVTNTNGSVYLNINNFNVSATSLGAGVYNANYSFVLPGTYNYSWFSYGNGIDNLINYSLNRSYIILNDSASPTVTLVSPDNPSDIFNRTVYFAANFADGSGLANATVYVWNSTGVIVNSSVYKNISGTTNSTNLSATVPYDGEFFWNYYACDNYSNCGFADTNRVIFVYTSKPLIDYSSETLSDSSRVWQNNIFVNVSVVSFNVANVTFNLYYSNNTPVSNTTYTTNDSSYSINWTNLSGDDYKYNVSVYDTLGNYNKTSTRAITLIDSQSNITLNSGWNLVALDMKNSNIGDKNISINAGDNLIGNSGSDINLENSNFTNSSGASSNWATAVAKGELNAYASYYDSSPAALSARKYKYAAAADLNMEDISLRKNRGYWIHANQPGTLTLPSESGSASGQTYAWRKLRFSNGTMELNITQAGSAPYSWIDNNLRYRWCDPDLYDDCSDPSSQGWQFYRLPVDKTQVSSWEGIFVMSNQDNITLIRTN